jgi:hypothetical protein
MEDLQQKIKSNSLKSGLLLGAILLVLSIFSFYMITGMASSLLTIILVPIVFSIIIPIGIVILFCFDLRKKIGGYWNLRQATTAIFIMFFAAYVIQYVGRDLIFAKLIEPNMVQKTQDVMVEATISMMEKNGVDQTQIDEKKAEIEKQFNDQKNVTIGKIIQGIVISIILMFVLALVFGAMFKKEPPLLADTSYEDPVV